MPLAIPRLRGCALAALAIVSASLPHPMLAADTTAASTAVSPVEATLPNGLRYTLLPHRHGHGAVSVRLVVRAGSLDERDEERGFAHFVEHMAFNGTRRFPPGRLREFFQELGLAFGADLNAATSFSHTLYKIDLPAGRAARLAEALDVLRDFADGIAFDPAEVRRERGVVLSELAARANDSGHVLEQRLAALYAGTRLPDRLPGGVPATLERADAAALRAFYRRCYTPARMSVVIVGDFDPAAAGLLLAERLGPLRPDRTAEPPAPFAEAPKGAVRARFVSSSLIRGAEVTLAAIAPTAPGTADEAALAMKLLERRLEMRRLTEPSRFARADAFQSGGTVPASAIAGLGLTCAADDWEAALRLVESELRRARERGFAAAEASEQLATRLAWARATVDTFAKSQPAAVADEIAASLANGEPWLHPAARLAELEKTAPGFTAEKARAALRRIFDPDRLHLLVTRSAEPAGGEAAILAAYHTHAARALDPEPAPAPPLDFRYRPSGATGAIAQRRTEADLGLELVAFANGARLNLRASPLEPRRFRLVARLGHGLADAPRDRPGLPHFAAHLLAEGDLGRHPRDEVRRLLGLHAINFHATFDQCYVIEAEGPAAELPFALQLITAELSDPKLDPLRLAQGQAAFATCVLSHTDDAQGRVRAAAKAQLFGHDPRLITPSIDQAGGYPFNELAQWIRAHWLAGPIEIGIVGDFDPAAVVAAAAASVGTLRTRPAPETRDLPALNAAPTHETHRETLSDEVAAVRLSWPVGDGLDARRAVSLRLVCEILEDRLHRALRQELGATYSPECDLSALGPRARTLVVAADLTLPPARAAELTARALGIAGELARGGATAEEFARLREPLSAEIEERRRDNEAWLEDLVGLAQSVPGGAGFFRAKPAALAALTLADVNRAAADFLAPSRASTTTVIPVAPAAVAPDAEPATAEDFARRGEARIARGDHDGALQDFERAIAVEPRNPTGFVARGLARQLRGDLDGAMADATHAIGLDPKSSAAYSNRSNAKLQLGAIDGAIADATKAIELEPRHINAYTARASARIARGDYNGAIADCDQALVIEAGNAVAYQNRAIARSHKGDLDGAIADTTTSIELEPRNADTFNNRGFFRQTKGELDAALPDFDRAIELNPAVRNAHRNRGLIHLARKRHAAALADLDRALELVPDDHIARFNRAIARQHLRDFDGAIADNDHFLRANADNPDAINNRGYARHLKGDHDGAIADFNRAIELRPNFALAFLNRAEAKRAKGDRTGAYEDRDRGLQLQSPIASRPSSPPTAAADQPKPATAALIRSAVEKRSRRDYAGALADLNRALTLDPKLSAAYFNRGLVHEARRDWRAAIADFDQALALVPNHADALNARGNARQQINLHTGALADFNAALKLQGDFPTALFNRGVSLRATGDLAGALADLDRVLEQSPGHANARANRACVRAALGDHAGAAADYDAEIARTSGPAAFTRLFRWINQRRLDSASATPAGEFARTVASWPDGWEKTAGCFLLGEMTEDAFLAESQATAGNTPGTRTTDSCYFAGVKRLLDGDTAGAKLLFQRSIGANQRIRFTHTLARAELARLPR